MSRRTVRLSDVLAAAGNAMAAANNRLAAAGAPAMVRDATLALEFSGQIKLVGDELCLASLTQPSLQGLALAAHQRLSNTSVSMTLTAAPAVRPAVLGAG